MKVDGDVNPADVFTKHSLSRDRLMKLMKLYDCKYTSGRAESAPQTRKGAEGKLTMADADEVYAAESQERLSEEVRDPDMPHLRLSEKLLESLHPPLVILPDQHDEPDLRDDDEDGIMVEGERIIKEITSEAQAHGRRRSARPTTTTTTRAAEACPGSAGPRSTSTTTATVRAAEACPGSAGPARRDVKRRGVPGGST